ncbi:hypothetical protein N7488_010783 [Penicillium malachiteum]|nr:hypothetical protein N7488_010783 [Penicillium malachiteum]
MSSNGRYHLSRAQLAEMPNPATVIHRRGTAFTFDADAYYRLVQTLPQPVNQNSPTVYAPSFDRAIKNPVTDDIPFPPSPKLLSSRASI